MIIIILLYHLDQIATITSNTTSVWSNVPIEMIIVKSFNNFVIIFQVIQVPVGDLILAKGDVYIIITRQTYGHKRFLS